LNGTSLPGYSGSPLLEAHPLGIPRVDSKPTLRTDGQLDLESYHSLQVGMAARIPGKWITRSGGLTAHGQGLHVDGSPSELCDRIHLGSKRVYGSFEWGSVFSNWFRSVCVALSKKCSFASGAINEYRLYLKRSPPCIIENAQTKES
jgi:hypothetical protein